MGCVVLDFLAGAAPGAVRKAMARRGWPCGVSILRGSMPGALRVPTRTAFGYVVGLEYERNLRHAFVVARGGHRPTHMPSISASKREGRKACPHECAMLGFSGRSNLDVDKDDRLHRADERRIVGGNQNCRVIVVEHRKTPNAGH